MVCLTSNVPSQSRLRVESGFQQDFGFWNSLDWLRLSVCSRTKRNTLTSSTATWRSTAPCTAPAPCTSRATSRTMASWAAETCSSSSGKPRWNCLTWKNEPAGKWRCESAVLIRQLWKPQTNSHAFPFDIFKWPRNCVPANLQNIEETLYVYHPIFYVPKTVKPALNLPVIVSSGWDTVYLIRN